MSSIREKIWHGKVLVRITVTEPNSIGSQEYLLVAGRLSYFSTHLTQVLQYFDQYLDKTKQGDWWLEYNNIPLSFNSPIGLLRDMFVGVNNSDPWNIILKRGEYPTGQILHFDEHNSLKNYWTNQLKESAYIRHGNSNAVMMLPQQEHEDLWWAINHSADLNELNSQKSFELFWKIIPLVLKKPRSPWNVPVKFYILSNESSRSYTTIQYTATSEQRLGEAISMVTEQSYFPMLHGVQILEDTPLGQLYLEGIYPDGFLHIVLHSVNR